MNPDATPPEDEPTSGAELFRRTALHPGGQAERALYIESCLPALRARADWSAELAGTTDDGTILYHKEGQIRVLAIRRDGTVYTGSWNGEVIRTLSGGATSLTCDWSSSDWRQW